MGRPFIPPFLTHQLIPSNSDWSLVFQLVKSDFGILYDKPVTTTTTTTTGTDPNITADENKYKLKLLKAELMLNRVALTRESIAKVNAQLRGGHLSGQNGLQFPFIDYKLVNISVPKGVKEFRSSNFMSSTYPRRMYIVFVAEDASLGSPTVSPFYYQHLNVRKLTLLINDVQRQIVTDFGTGIVAEAYFKLIRALGISHRSFAYTKEQFQQAASVFCFDLTVNHAAMCPDYSAPDDQANWHISLEFNRNTDSNYQMYVLQEYEAIMQINADNVVSIV